MEKYQQTKEEFECVLFDDDDDDCPSGFSTVDGKGEIIITSEHSSVCKYE